MTKRFKDGDCNPGTKDTVNNYEVKSAVWNMKATQDTR